MRQRNRKYRRRHCGFLLLAAVCASSLAATPGAFLRDQVEAELHAERLLKRTGLQAEIASLEVTWRNHWPTLAPATLAQVHRSLEELAFLVALEEVNSDPRRPRLIQISMPSHRWMGHTIPGGRWGIDNPDTQYFLVPVEVGSSYILRGKRAPHGPADVNFSFGAIERWNTIENIGKDKLDVAENGSYTITLDATPANGRRNHLQLTPAGNCILIRNTLADWNTDTIDHMSVARTAGPAAAPPLDDEALEREVKIRLGDMLNRVIDTLQAPVFKLPANVLPQPGATGDKAGFLSTQRNALGHFRLAADEALIVSIQPGGAGYSTVPVANVWGVTPEYWSHTSSLNSRQAVANSDGSFTVVVAAHDPGIANWVDTAGLEEGILMLRWQVLPARGNPGQQPQVKSLLVKQKDLYSALPASVVRYNRVQRKTQLQSREAGFARRLTGR